MDVGTIILLVTAVIGGIAAVVATLNGIYELREKRRKSREASAAATAKSVPVPASASPVPLATAETPAAVVPPRRLTNLPAQSTRLIGRDDELAEVKALLLRPDVRLVTLTGPGGIGKTRVALQVAADLLDHYADGAFVVVLGAVGDANLVIPTLAKTLDMREQGGRPLPDILKDHLREKHMLLVLDNFEQVVPATPVIAELLATAPGLQVIAASRAILHLSGEYIGLSLA